MRWVVENIEDCFKLRDLRKLEFTGDEKDWL
jgi:hypothetical protein